MKKAWLLPLALTLALLSGCGASTAGMNSASLSQSLWSDEDVATPPPEEKLTFHLETEVRENSARAKDGTLLVEYKYEVPVLGVLTADGTEVETAATLAQENALAVAQTFNANFAGWGDSKDLEQSTQWAQEDYDFNPKLFQDGISYDSSLTYSAYQTEHLISIRADYYAFTGGAHGNTSLLAWNFDLDSGKFVTAADLSEDPTAFSEVVTEELLAQMDQKAADAGLATDDYFWADRADIATQWTSYAVSFNDSGMTVGFSPYELACYAAGSQEFTLDYEFLTPYLSDYGKQILGLSVGDPS